MYFTLCRPTWRKKIITQKLSLLFQILVTIYLNLKDNASIETSQIILIIEDLLLRTFFTNSVIEKFNSLVIVQNFFFYEGRKFLLQTDFKIKGNN